MIRAKIERVENGVLRGWFWNRDAAAARQVEVWLNGEFAGMAEARVARADLLRAGIGDGNHAFEFPIPSKWRNGGLHQVDLKPIGTSIIVATASFLVEPKSQDIVGKVERIDDGVIIGWSYDRLAPETRLSVHGFVDGKEVAATRADRRRADLIKGGRGDGHYGFHLKLPAEILSGHVRACEVRTGPETGSHLLGAIPIGRLPKPSPLSQPAAKPPPSAEASAAASPAALSQDLESRATRAFREVVPSAIFAHAKFKKEADAMFVAEEGDGWTLNAVEVSGWFRLLKRLPNADMIKDQDWAFGLAANSAAAAAFSLSLLYFDEPGSFKIWHRVARSAQLSPGPNELRFAVKARELAESFPDAIGNSPCFIAVEFNTPFYLSDFRFAHEHSEPEPETIPYRKSAMRNHKRLLDLNNRLSQAGKANLGKWMLELAEVAVRLECFETAASVLNNARELIRSKPELQRQHLVVESEVAFAEGRIDDLRSLLLQNSEHVLKDDHLFTALSLCFPASAELTSFFGQLPSGRPNRCYLSRTTLIGDSLRVLMGQIKDDEDGQSDLLLASLMRTTAPSEYIKALNRFLSRHQMRTISSINLASDNAIAELAFESGPVVAESSGLVSVIISAYNTAETIGYSIQSVLNQDYPEIELLIADDGSSDSTLEEISAFERHPAVRVFRSKGNQGPYNIRNSLIEQARGKFITFQDADDVSHPERISRQVQALETSGAQAAIGRWIRIRPDGEIVFFRDQQCLRMCVVSLLVERNLFERYGGYRRVLCGGDSELLERIRLDEGPDALAELKLPLIFGLWSAQSLTQQGGLEATEDGYRSPARRAYAEASSRLRLLGPEIIDTQLIDQVNKESGIFRDHKGVFSVRYRRGSKAAS